MLLGDIVERFMLLPMIAYLLAAILIAAGLLRLAADYWIIAGVAVIGSLFLGQVVMHDGPAQSLEIASEFIAATTVCFVAARLIRTRAASRAEVASARSGSQEQGPA